MVLVAVTLPHLGDGDWMRGDSGWYAAIALKAWRTGELWTLYEGPGRPYFNKPPLVFWVQGAWMWIAGVGAWQARLATVAAAAVCVAVVGGIARSLAGRRAALVCGVLLAVNIEFFRRTREISLDMWNLAFMLVAAWALVRIAVRSRGDHAARGARAGSIAWPVVIAGAALGASLMTKPLVGLAAPVPVIAWLIFERAAGSFRASPRPAIGRAMGAVAAAAILGAAIAAPWHLSMMRVHGDEFVGSYFGREVLARGTGELVGGQKATQPAWFYAANAAAGWTMWALAAALFVVGQRGWRIDPARATLLRFGVSWGVGWLVLLTLFPDRRDRYALPVHAGLAVAAGALVGGRSRGTGRMLRIAPVAVAGVGVIVGMLPIRVQREANEQWPALTTWLDEHPGLEPWDGGFSGAPAARVYLMTGLWPRTTRDVAGRLIADPPVGSVLLYHRRGGWAPGPGEREEWSAGDLRATRLVTPPWAPVETPDPGE